jgi:hypothetical protein
VWSFLDKAGDGVVDLAAVVEAPQECLEELDDDVSHPSGAHRA